jgi:hypothetical protein
VNRSEYVRRVLDAYRATPETCGVVRHPDRLLAAQLHEHGVAIHFVEDALILAAARRLTRAAGVPPLAPIRSLAYFLPVIEEVMHLEVGREYFQHLRRRVASLTART